MCLQVTVTSSINSDMSASACKPDLAITSVVSKLEVGIPSHFSDQFCVFKAHILRSINHSHPEDTER